MITILFELGCRNEELRYLKLENLKPDYLVKIEGKGKKQRLVPIDPNVFTELYKFVMSDWVNKKKIYCFINPDT